MNKLTPHLLVIFTASLSKSLQVLDLDSIWLFLLYYWALRTAFFIFLCWYFRYYWCFDSWVVIYGLKVASLQIILIPRANHLYSFSYLLFILYTVAIMLFSLLISDVKQWHLSQIWSESIVTQSAHQRMREYCLLDFHLHIICCIAFPCPPSPLLPHSSRFHLTLY